MEQHLERLKNSLRKMDMLARVDLEQVRQRVERAVSEAAMAETLVYFQISRGVALAQLCATMITLMTGSRVFC